MKDFYDIWFLAKNFRFDGAVLGNAIHATFARRRTDLPNGLPFALSSAFAAAPAKQVQWKAFITRTSTASPALDLPTVVDGIRAFLIPILDGLTRPATSPRKWNPETGWTSS